MMKQNLMILAAGLLLASCSGNGGSRPFMLEGAWMLQEVRTPQGDTFSYNTNDGTWLRIYEGDSVMNEFELSQSEQTLVVRPSERCGIRLIDKGGGEWVYLEEEYPRPLTVVDDSTITIQRMGRVYTWQRRDDIAYEWGEEIRSIAKKNLKDGLRTGNQIPGMQPEQPREQLQYVLSAKEREQANIISGFVYAMIAFVVLMVIIVQIALAQRREKRRLQLQLSQIHEEHAELQPTVKQAIKMVESDFFDSAEYEALQRRMATGQILNADDWQTIENHLRGVYPGFTSRLRSLYDMSDLQYQVCLLIKLRIPTKDIAAVLARDMSTISTVRSRLYEKVFGHKGGAREWDKFVLSIGV